MSTAALAYQVRSNAGTVVSQHSDADDAHDALIDSGRRHDYVVFVELIDGVWTAQED